MNQTVIEILTEETSMDNFLRIILPEVLPKDYAIDVNCFIRPHEGKSHLMKSIPKKMKAYPHFGYPIKVLIIQDQDSNDCMVLKSELSELCKTSGSIPYVIRIACRELENWYLGDLNAIENVYPESHATRFLNSAKFKNPDSCYGSNELKLLSKKFTKTYASKSIPRYFKINENKSKSFNHFLKGLQRLIATE